MSRSSSLTARSGAKRGEVRVRDVHMGAHELDAVRGHESQGPCRTLVDVLGREMRLELGENLDAFEERPRLVPPGPSRREGGVEVDVRLHEGRQRETPRALDALLALKWLDLVVDAGEDAVLDPDAGGYPVRSLCVRPV